MNRHTLFETRRQFLNKTGFIVKSCFLYTKLDSCNDLIKANLSHIDEVISNF